MRIVVIVVALSLWPSLVPQTAAQQPACRFVLGFATLRDLVGPQKVGACLEDEAFNLENGNAEQRTTGGLMVWRKVDNFTAFTDGGTTWVNGPNGLQSRPNSERFSWERDPIQPVRTTAPAPAGPQAAPAAAPPATATQVAVPASAPATATAAPPTAAPATKPTGNCHPSYPDFCIPPPPPDVNCNSPVVAGRKNFRVTGPDVHRLDQGGRPGIACES